MVSLLFKGIQKFLYHKSFVYRFSFLFFQIFDVYVGYLFGIRKQAVLLITNMNIYLLSVHGMIVLKNILVALLYR